MQAYICKLQDDCVGNSWLTIAWSEDSTSEDDTHIKLQLYGFEIAYTEKDYMYNMM